ncbi:MAG: glycosyltransferase [Thiohalomonadaceae bacterium]
MDRLGIVVIGLSVTSSWGNGHATTYRGLLRALYARGHDVLFLERDKPWYAQNRDLPTLPYGRLALYDNVEALKESHAAEVRNADLVIVGSYVPDGIAVGDWVLRTARGVRAFYDIDTPVTFAQLASDTCPYLARRQIPQYDIYFSFTGGPALPRLQKEFGARRAVALYCSVDPAHYHPEPVSECWDLGYIGTYAPDRQPALERLFMQPARQWNEGRFVCAGPQYPAETPWSENVLRIEHLPPSEHRLFYNRQRFTLNVTRADMVRLGWSPSVRLFEAAACATPIVSDRWAGLETVFTPGKEIAVVASGDEVLALLRDMPAERRIALGEQARRRVLAQHTSEHRAEELENAVLRQGAGALA